MNFINADERWMEIINLCKGLETKVFDAQQRLPAGVGLFGAGPHGQAAARYLLKKNARILFFADNDAAKQGTTIDGIKVISPRDIPVSSSTIVLIAARHAVIPVTRQLTEMNLSCLSFDAFFTVTNFERIERVRNRFLQGEKSQLSFDGIIKTMLTGNKEFCASVLDMNQFFAIPEFFNIGVDHFVDAGAYVGDTVEKFIWANNGVFKQIYAFEPSALQLSALHCRVERLCKEWAILPSKITCEHAGLSDEDRQLPVSVNADKLQCASVGRPSASGDAGSNMVWVRSLDKYLAGRPATFIKADIEGMEMAMLRGARQTIRTFKPKMALSIYHEPTDLFEIAEYVHELVPDYHMELRQHAPVLMDSVLYCRIKE